MSTKEERDEFWKSVALASLAICLVFLIGGGLFVIDGVRYKTELNMYKKLCPIEQLKEADNGGKN